ncbi:stalk domain-containing protein [Effusibacillus lacus]|uniref:Copper amine oxidase-like N-terminal domain-containing protein n=1 Tax=Effusibacillus lacus TaxID=1348429 RepID=A0A292YJI1_9BACL|nr:stalk domain-containing protein [Effusibacillus lacus]TCS75456.1 trypsin-like peptidase [Effusibacillus lacus]GAX88923.1 hypothetical protein EFBL_0537 [Effusibacillus lacus]
MKKILILLLVVFAVLAGPGMANASSGIKVTIDGKEQHYDQPPVLVNGRTLVPLRGIFESLGAKIDWNGDTQTVTATRGSTTIVLQVGSKLAIKNGQPVTLDVEAQLINGRTMVPVRFVGEALGAGVNWDSGTNTVVISTQGMTAERRKMSIQEIVAENDHKVVMVITDNNSRASAFAVGDGLFLTNYHVVDEASKAVILTKDKKEYEVQGIVAYSEQQDLALLKTKEKTGIPSVKFGSAKQAQKGEHVIAIGNPLSLSNTVSEGIISSFRQESGVDLIQISVPVTFGSSGGALFNEYGEVIGITTLGIINSGADLNFAVAIDHATPWLETTHQDFDKLEASFPEENAVIKSLKERIKKHVVDGMYKNNLGLSTTEAAMFLELTDETDLKAFSGLSEQGKKRLMLTYTAENWGDVLGVDYCYTYVVYGKKKLVAATITYGMSVDEVELVYPEQ